MAKRRKKGLAFLVMSLLMMLAVGIGATSLYASAQATAKANALAMPSGRIQNKMEEPVLRSKNPDVPDISTVPVSDFTDMKYIPNSKYFRVNPQHFDGTKSTAKYGSCTTIAMQMLMGYHNYYSDRRLIPELGNTGKRLLSTDYGNINEHPEINSSFANLQGRPSIGTQDEFYQELYNFTLNPEAGLQQSVYNVADAAMMFIKKYNLLLEKNVTLSAGGFEEAVVRSEIDAGRPVILGKAVLNGMDFHVLPAYGYASYKGESGFIVHYGWGDMQTHAWVPTDWFTYQITMQVEHTHSFFDTGIDVSGAQTYRKLTCSTCGCDTVEPLCIVNDAGDTITGLRYPVESNLSIPSQIDGTSITAIGSSAFAGSRITGISLPYNVARIGDGAFEDCARLSSFSGYGLETIGESAFKGCSSLQTINIQSDVIDIGEQAFSGCDNLRIWVSSSNANFSAAGNVLYNKDKTAILHTGAIDSDFTVPGSVTEIGPYAFAGNGNLSSVRFGHAPSIGERAFADCPNLHRVEFGSYTAPQAGADVFYGDAVTIFVPYIAQDLYKAAFPGQSDNIVSAQFVVNFSSDGTTVTQQTVYNGSAVEELPAVTKKGNRFAGWYADPQFSGTPYKAGDLWESETDLTLYAKWQPLTYSVTLNTNAPNGQIVGPNPVDVVFGSTGSLGTTAEREGYKLDGWFDAAGGGTQYFTGEGACMRPWDVDANATLYAHWTKESYEIQINNDGTITWLGRDGLSDDPCSLQYGDVLDAINLIDTFKNSSQGFKEGHIFGRFRYDGAAISWSTVPDLGEDGAVITIYPEWDLEEHTVYFNTLYELTVAPMVAFYGTDIRLPNIVRSGYTFDGWFTAASGGTKVEWIKMPDLTPNGQANGSTMLYAHQTPINYTVSYQANGGWGTMAPTTHRYATSQTLSRNAFYKTGHDFTGWATTPGGDVVYSDGQSVINLTEVANDTVYLYAVWEAKTYNIIYRNLTPEMNAYPKAYTYGQGVSSQPKIFLPHGYGETEMDTPYAWYTSTAFTTRVYSISATQTGDVILYAKYDYWIGGVYTSYKQTVTNSYQPTCEVRLDLKSYYHDRVKNTTLSHIKIVFSMDLWEVNDGYQDLYLDCAGFSDPLWSKKLEHGAGTKNTQRGHYQFEIVLNLNQYADVDMMELRFGAHGAFANTWEFDNFKMDIYLIN